MDGERLARLEAHVAAIDERSDERLDYLRERFDRIEARLDREDQSTKWWSGVLLSVCLSVAGSFYYMTVEPLLADMKSVERRLLSVEQLTAIANPTDPL